MSCTVWSLVVGCWPRAHTVSVGACLVPLGLNDP